MDRARTEHLKPATQTTTTYMFMVNCDAGNYAVFVEAQDEPKAWVKFTAENRLHGVRSIEVQAQPD